MIYFKQYKLIILTLASLSFMLMISCTSETDMHSQQELTGSSVMSTGFDGTNPDTGNEKDETVQISENHSFSAETTPSQANLSSNDEPTVTHGPYLIDMSETTVTVMWFTDLDCTGKVEYWEDGGPVISPEYAFNTFDSKKKEFSFYFMTDIHNNPTVQKVLFGLMKAGECDFVVYGGDFFEPRREELIFDYLIDPSVEKFAKYKPFVFVRGNHEWRGQLSSELYNYVPYSTGKFYYRFNHGPVEFLVLDTGEDKHDDHPEIAGLNYSAGYRREELDWCREQVARDEWRNASFRIFLQHQPGFGEEIDHEAWNTFAKESGVDLIFAGHTHEFNYQDKELYNLEYNLLTLHPFQIAKIDVSQHSILLKVYNAGGEIEFMREITQK